jgi:hypothetical protein
MGKSRKPVILNVLTCFSSLKLRVGHEITMPSVCPLFEILEQFTDFHEGNINI